MKKTLSNDELADWLKQSSIQDESGWHQADHDQDYWTQLAEQRRQMKGLMKFGVLGLFAVLIQLCTPFIKKQQQELPSKKIKVSGDINHE